MAGYFNPNDYDAYDIGGKLFGAMQAGRVDRARDKARSYLDSGDYDSAASAIMPYDQQQAEGYLSLGKRKRDEAYSSGLAPYVSSGDWSGAKQYAVSKSRPVDDLMKLETWASSARDQEKKAMADKLDQAASGLYAAAQFAETGDMDGYNGAIEALAGQGFDVKDFQGQPYNPARLNAELVKSKKGLEILGVVNDTRKTDIADRRADAADRQASAAEQRADAADRRADNQGDGVGGSGYSKDQLSAANTYRDDYNNSTKDFRTLASEMRRSESYYQRAYAGKPSGQGDIGLVYALAKAYDPTSVVREGEFNTMNASSGVKNKLTGLYTKAAGEGFSPEVRTEIMRELRSQYGAQKALYDTTRSQYVDMANRIKVDPNMVAMDYSAGVPQAPGRPTDLPNATENKGVTATDPETGETWYSDGRSWQRKR